jgi:hypothetical protein
VRHQELNLAIRRGRSADAFWTLLAATALVVAFGPYAAVAFVVPLLLLVVSGRDARSSSGRTRR